MKAGCRALPACVSRLMMSVLGDSEVTCIAEVFAFCSISELIQLLAIPLLVCFSRSSRPIAKARCSVLA